MWMTWKAMQFTTIYINTSPMLNLPRLKCTAIYLLTYLRKSFTFSCSNSWQWHHRLALHLSKHDRTVQRPWDSCIECQNGACWSVVLHCMYRYNFAILYNYHVPNTKQCKYNWLLHRTTVVQLKCRASRNKPSPQVGSIFWSCFLHRTLQQSAPDIKSVSPNWTWIKITKKSCS